MKSLSQPLAVAALPAAERAASAREAGEAQARLQAPLDIAPVGGRLMSMVAPAVVAIALISAFLSFLVLTGFTPIRPTHEVVVAVLTANGVLIFILLVVVLIQGFRLFQARRKGRAAAGLHVRIVLLFTLVAALPAVLLAGAATVTLDRGLDRWFSERARTIVDNSLTVAQTYVREHANFIRGDILAMAIDVARARPLFEQDRPRFKQFFSAQAAVRGLPGAFLVRGNQELVERAELVNVPEFPLPQDLRLADITEDEPRAGLVGDADYVAAAIKLRGYDDLYLFVARPIDAQVIAYLRETQANVVEYRTLADRRLGVQVAFGLLFTVIALIVLLSAVLTGLGFANRLVAPIRRLVSAADLVAAGNLYVQVPTRRGEGDISHLSDTFNKMTRELASQRNALVTARDQIDQRRRFTEAVLSGVSAGVIGLDHESRVTIATGTAQSFLGLAEKDLLGEPIAEVVPELSALIEAAARPGTRPQRTTLKLSRGGTERTFSVQVTRETGATAEEGGLVVTLDDITELVVAQRTSAWADVARRIAHEIKNPLTPIQLSAERIKRRYGKVITEDREVFDQCTDTIIRQVGDIGRMVDEFSSFARMPKPVMEKGDYARTVREIIVMMRIGNPEIEILSAIPDQPIEGKLDRRLVSQALTNIIKNATEAVMAVDDPARGKGRVVVRVARVGTDVVVDIVDNGLGFPKENRARLLEPYVTTREKGTGLGLAIVAKIAEDHGGRIELNDAPPVPGETWTRGAWVRLVFAVDGGMQAAPEAPPAKAVAGRGG